MPVITRSQASKLAATIHRISLTNKNIVPEARSHDNAATLSDYVDDRTSNIHGSLRNEQVSADFEETFTDDADLRTGIDSFGDSDSVLSTGSAGGNSSNMNDVGERILLCSILKS